MCARSPVDRAVDRTPITVDRSVDRLTDPNTRFGPIDRAVDLSQPTVIIFEN